MVGKPAERGGTTTGTDAYWNENIDIHIKSGEEFFPEENGDVILTFNETEGGPQAPTPSKIKLNPWLADQIDAAINGGYEIYYTDIEPTEALEPKLKNGNIWWDTTQQTYKKWVRLNDQWVDKGDRYDPSGNNGNGEYYNTKTVNNLTYVENNFLRRLGNYYVDAINGVDSNDAESLSTPVQTMEKLADIINLDRPQEAHVFLITDNTFMDHDFMSYGAVIFNGVNATGTPTNRDLFSLGGALNNPNLENGLNYLAGWEGGETYFQGVSPILPDISGGQHIDVPVMLAGLLGKEIGFGGNLLSGTTSVPQALGPNNTPEVSFLCDTGTLLQLGEGSEGDGSHSSMSGRWVQGVAAGVPLNSIRNIFQFGNIVN